MLEYAFVVASAISASAAALAFLFRRVVNSVLAISVAAAMCSALLYLMGQGTAALLQLFVVAGITASLIVVMPGEEVKSKRASIVVFAESAAVIALLFMYASLSEYSVSESAAANSFASYVSVAFSSYYLMVYALAALLFAGVAGSILALSRVSRLAT